jgi:hypothetical protein
MMIPAIPMPLCQILSENAVMTVKLNVSEKCILADIIDESKYENSDTLNVHQQNVAIYKV